MRRIPTHPPAVLLSLSAVLASTIVVAGLPVSAETLPASASKQATKSQTVAANSSAAANLEPMIELTPKLDVEEPKAPLPTATPAASEATDEATPAEAGAPGREPLKARAVLVDINSHTLNYDKERDVYVATGSAHVVISEQNSELTADKVTYDQKTGMMIAEGHVVIIKNGQKTEGTYAKIDLNRQSALINDAMTTVKAVRIKAEKSFVTSKYIELEDGKFIISGQGMLQLQKTGGLGNFAQATGKGSNQARLNREYFKKIRDQRAMFSPLDPIAMANQKSLEPQEFNFNDDKNSVSRFNLHVKEITVHRHEDGFDEVDLKWPSLYMGRFKVASMPANEFAYDEVSKQYTYLGPDIGASPNMGGFYLGPGWDFRLGRGAVRFSPLVTLGSAGFQTTNGKDGEDKGFGPGLGGIVHFRDPDTTLDLSYNTRVGTPVLFADRRLFSDNVHFMAAHNDFYKNGLIGQTERPNYIAQITDYRVLKEFNNFLLTSFESVGWARDNFNPNNSDSYFVNPTSPDPQSAGRIQLQAQIQNIKPLIQLGKHVNFGLRGQVAAHGYTTGDMLGILRGGPTMNLNFKRLQTRLGYFQTVTSGQSPFVFDAYIGGSRNMTLDNTLFLNNYITIGSHQSLNLQRDNATNSLAVGNTFFIMVGPPDVKMQIGFDVINRRSHFGINYFPGGKNTVVNYDRMKIFQPENYSGTSMIPAKPASLPQ
jgi:hypothetical protein